MSRSYVYSVWHLTKSRYHLSKQEYREVCMEDIMLKTYSNHFGGFLLYLTCVHQNRVCSNKQHILELLIFATCFVSVLLILYIYYVIIIRKQLLKNFVSLSFYTSWFDSQTLKTRFNKVNVHNDVYLYSNFFFRYLAKTFSSPSTVKNICVFALN